MQHRPNRRTGIARNRLHEDVTEARPVFQRGNEQRVEAQAAGETQVGPLPRHANHGILYRPLQSRRDVRRLRLGADALEEFRTEAAIAAMLRAEEAAIQARTRFAPIEDL